MKAKILTNIEYCAGTHTYRHNGEILTSVTRIIDTYSHFKDVNKDILEKAAMKGSMLHQDIEHYLATGEAWGDVQGFVDVFEWVKKQYGDVIAYEEIVGAEVDLGIGEIKYAGRLDIRLNEAIVEIKRKVSGEKMARHYATQCAGYDIATGEKAIAYVLIYMHNDRWKVHIHNNVNSARKAFEYMLIKYICNNEIEKYLNTLF